MEFAVIQNKSELTKSLETDMKRVKNFEFGKDVPGVLHLLLTLTLDKKRIFPLKISLVSVTKSAEKQNRLFLMLPNKMRLFVWSIFRD